MAFGKRLKKRNIYSVWMLIEGAYTRSATTDFEALPGVDRIIKITSIAIVSVFPVEVVSPVEVSITLVIVPLKPYFIRIPCKTTSREPLQPTIDLWRRVWVVPGIRHLRDLCVLSAIEVFQSKQAYWWRGVVGTKIFMLPKKLEGSGDPGLMSIS